MYTRLVLLSIQSKTFYYNNTTSIINTILLYYTISTITTSISTV